MAKTSGDITKREYDRGILGHFRARLGLINRMTNDVTESCT